MNMTDFDPAVEIATLRAKLAAAEDLIDRLRWIADSHGRDVDRLTELNEQMLSALRMAAYLGTMLDHVPMPIRVVFQSAVHDAREAIAAAEQVTA